MNHNMQMQKETGKILHRKFLSENIGLLLIKMYPIDWTD